MRKFIMMAVAAFALSLTAPLTASASTSLAPQPGTSKAMETSIDGNSVENCRCRYRYYRVYRYRVRYYPVRYYRTYRVVYRWYVYS